MSHAIGQLWARDMHFNLSGSSKVLRKFAAKLREVGSDRVLRHLSDNLAEEGLDLIAEGFATETDPDGNKWKPKVFGDGRQILVGKTTRLRRGWHRKYIAATGFILAPAVNYAKHQQQGTGLYGPHHHRIVPTTKKALAFTVQTRVAPKIRPGASAIVPVTRRGSGRWKGSTVFFRSVKGAVPRRMIPSGKRLPAKWQRRMQECAHDFFVSYFAKK